MFLKLPIVCRFPRVTMTAHENPRPSFPGGVLEERHYRDSNPEDRDRDHEASTDADSDHDDSSHDEHHDDIEAHFGSLTQPMTREKTRASGDLRRTASNVLTAVASRITTRGWPEPPPPPDGGVKAWIQVACVCVDAIYLGQKGNNTSTLMLD